MLGDVTEDVPGNLGLALALIFGVPLVVALGFVLWQRWRGR